MKDKVNIDFIGLLLKLVYAIIPLVGMLYAHWNVYTIVFLFAAETVFIGVLHFIRLQLSKLPGSSPYFFLLHYGIFVGVQTILLVVFFWPGDRWDSREFIQGCLSIGVGLMIQFTHRYLTDKTFTAKEASAILLVPYVRIFIQQFFIIVCGAFVLGVEHPNEWLIAGFFVGFKLLFEILFLLYNPLKNIDQ